MKMMQTLFEKIWNHHIVQEKNGLSLLYVDRHLLHEVTSPQAFAGLRNTGRRVRRPDLTIATVDHNVPTEKRSLPILDKSSRVQIQTLEKNCKDFGIRLYGMKSEKQGIVHIIGPELGITLPGTTLVCGDSHTSTHGALGSLAFGIGTSEVEHVLASQTIWMKQPIPMEVRMKGRRHDKHSVTAKDMILSLIRKIGISGGTGTVLEYRGDAIRDLDIDGRMTICNMSIEAGSRAGLVSPDETTFEYIRDRQCAPKDFDAAVQEWKKLETDNGAKFAKSVTIDVSRVAPQVSWGTNPAMTCNIDETVPDPEEYAAGNSNIKKDADAALKYMDLEKGTPITDIRLDRVFIGSCTNARLRDLSEAARAINGGHVADGVRAMVVPGSQQVKAQAERAGLDKIFIKAGFEWRESGCSMCLGMNPDILCSGQRCASTSNRNFEGRQGAGGRTHLVSPVMAAAAAIAGRFVDVREISLT
ncbi:MAG: 3-isopropylmalate dehydratase large subunit [Cenarchaeum symbiont of Oopsacas minuta]|nr:3-isopropylmalate dehydratase large subunit [Cenarchaeum symbiont of Oopsacas minuta]